jgi:renalase
VTKTEHTAVIGAGLAGLTCARALADAGHSVVVFDKGRGLGGRMASRRKEGWHFDHGAVVLRATSDRFAAFLTSALAKRWEAANGFTGVPGISSLVKPLAQGLKIVGSQRVTGLEKTQAGWSVQGPEDAAGLIFDRVILAIPQPQALALLSPWPALSTQIEGVRMEPCWTLMVGFDRTLATNIGYSDTCTGPLSVIARETGKPGRSLPGDGWVIQANSNWTCAHLGDAPEQIEALLLAAFFKSIDCDPTAPVIAMAHRWLYALTATPLGRSHILDAELGLASVGTGALATPRKRRSRAGAT